jgi:hypothetical protein
MIPSDEIFSSKQRWGLVPPKRVYVKQAALYRDSCRPEGDGQPFR